MAQFSTDTIKARRCMDSRVASETAHRRSLSTAVLWWLLLCMICSVSTLHCTLVDGTTTRTVFDIKSVLEV